MFRRFVPTFGALACVLMVVAAPQAAAAGSVDVAASSYGTLYHLAALVEGLLETILFPVLWVVWKIFGNFNLMSS